MVIGLLLASIILITFVSKLLNCNLPMNKLMFLSIFTMIIGISIFIYCITINSNFAFFMKYTGFIFSFYGAATGVQALRRD